MFKNSTTRIGRYCYATVVKSNNAAGGNSVKANTACDSNGASYVLQSGETRG